MVHRTLRGQLVHAQNALWTSSHTELYSKSQYHPTMMMMTSDDDGICYALFSIRDVRSYEGGDILMCTFSTQSPCTLNFARKCVGCGLPRYRHRLCLTHWERHPTTHQTNNVTYHVSDLFDHFHINGPQYFWLALSTWCRIGPRRVVVETPDPCDGTYDPLLSEMWMESHQTHCK